MCRTPLEVMICTEICPNLSNPLTLFQHLYETYSCESLVIKDTNIKELKEEKKEKTEKKEKKKKNVSVTNIDNEPKITSSNISNSSLTTITTNESTNKYTFYEEAKLYSPTVYINNVLMKLLIFSCPECNEVKLINFLNSLYIFIYLFLP